MILFFSNKAISESGSKQKAKSPHLQQKMDGQQRLVPLDEIP